MALAILSDGSIITVEPNKYKNRINRMKTLGLDIGTTTISAVIYDNDAVVARKTVKNDSFLSGESWERLQDPRTIRSLADATIHELLMQHPDVCALGVTGQMHGILYLDPQGEPLSPLYLWQDGRGDLPFDRELSWAQALSRLTGYSLATGYGMVTHWYNLNQGLVPERAACLCTISDYLAMELAGCSTPVMDFSNAASLGLYDMQAGAFDHEAFHRAGIDVAILPPLASRPYLGTGALGIPVYAAIGDNQASFLGAVGGRTDALLVNMGTGGQISLYSPGFVQSEALETRPFPDGGWLLVGSSLCGGRSYAILENLFRQTIKMVTGKDESVYDAMERLLSSTAPVHDFPQASTLFQGTRKDPSIRATIQNISAENFTPLHLMYSIMNGMADELYDLYRGGLTELDKKPTVMIASGNGLRRNLHLQQIFRQKFGCPLLLSENEEEAACGAAIYAAKHATEKCV